VARTAYLRRDGRLPGADYWSVRNPLRRSERSDVASPRVARVFGAARHIDRGDGDVARAGASAHPLTRASAKS
jgi:hypothetical protein